MAIGRNLFPSRDLNRSRRTRGRNRIGILPVKKCWPHVIETFVTTKNKLNSTRPYRSLFCVELVLTSSEKFFFESIIANGAGEYDTTRESTPRPIIETIPNVVISRLLVISKSEWIHLRFPACGPGFANYGR